MSAVLLGALFAAGFLLTVNVSRMSRNLVMRSIGMYSGALLDSPNQYVANIQRKLQRLLTESSLAPWGTDQQVRVVILHSGSNISVSSFRQRQVQWTLASSTMFTAWLSIRAMMSGAVQPIMMVVGFLLILPSSGWLVLELQKNAATKRANQINLELPTVLDLLAFSVTAGESIISAMGRISETCSGEISKVFNQGMQDLHSGQTMQQVFRAIRVASSSSSFFRSMHAIELALDYGSPLADILRAQAQEARSSFRQDLLRLAGKKDTLMMIPVIFLILPMIIFVALFPGLQALHLN